MPTKRAIKKDDALLVDTNILFEASDRKRAHHASALELLEWHPALFMPAQVVREFLVVATRPAAQNGLGLDVSQALESVAGFRVNIRLLPEEKPILAKFLELVSTSACSGKRLHDAHLVATALVHKVAAIVTLNAADFAPFAERVRVVAPELIKG